MGGRQGGPGTGGPGMSVHRDGPPGQIRLVSHAGGDGGHPDMVGMGGGHKGGPHGGNHYMEHGGKQAGVPHHHHNHAHHHAPHHAQQHHHHIV
eukprot:290012-Chlamydomonas_euryale.AAC.1